LEEQKVLMTNAKGNFISHLYDTFLSLSDFITSKDVSFEIDSCMKEVIKRHQTCTLCSFLSLS